MCEPKIPGGCILLSRKIIESSIWDKPPLYLKVWLLILSKAQHKDYKLLKRGELRISIPEITEKCSWHVGYRKVTPTKDQIFQVLEWLRRPIGSNSRNPYESNAESNARAMMITTTKATQGILVNVVNYEFYQTLENYESNNESTDEKPTKAIREQRTPNNINKNDKNGKNDKLFLSDSNEYRLANYLREKILANNPTCRVPDDKKLQSWCNTINLMIRIDQRDIEDIKAHILFSQTDTFWKNNLLSADKLRKQYDLLTGKMKQQKEMLPDKNKQVFPKCKIV